MKEKPELKIEPGAYISVNTRAGHVGGYRYIITWIEHERKSAMYKVLDKELMLEECNIGDLTLDQIESFLRLWGEGSKIETLTLYLKNDGTVVLNKDNSDYELYKKMAYISLKGGRGSIEKLRNKIPDGFGETLNTLESAINVRRTNEMMEMLKYNLVEPEGVSYGVLKKILEYYESNVFGLYKILTLGYILGKRAERARKKK